MANPVDDAFSSETPGSRGAIVDLLKRGLINAFTSITQVQGLDLSGHDWIIIGTSRDFYQFDAASVAVHDGVVTVVDSEGNRFIKRSGITTASLVDHHGAGEPSDVLGEDGDTYLNTSNGDLYLKDSGAWGEAIFNIKGEPGVSTLNMDGGRSDTLYGGTPEIDGGDSTS